MNTTATLAIICGEAEHSALIFPTSSALALRVYQALEDPDCNAKTATRLIQAEPLLSARIVAIANSAAFNRSHVLVSNVRVGITRLGFKMVRMLAMSMVVDQMDGKSDLAAHQGLAQRLWEHTAHVAALAQVIARRITHQNPEAAMFAGMVHEIGGFYLLSRAKDFPGLLEALSEPLEADEDASAPESGIGSAVLTSLSVPEPVLAALEVLWSGYLTFPTVTLGDTLLLADRLAPVRSPLFLECEQGQADIAASIDMSVGQDTLSGILAESAEEVASLTAALRL